MSSRDDDARVEQLARIALDSWDLRVTSIELVSRSENVVYRVRAEGGDLALRVHRPGYHTRAELDSEQVWNRALKAAGVGVPVGVPTCEGEDYVEVALPGSGESRHVGVVPWFDGVTLRQRMHARKDPKSALSDFEQLGEVMAKIHNQASGWTPPAGFTRHALDADGLMGETPFWGPFWELHEMSAEQCALLSDTRVRLHDELSSLDKDPQTYSMIHADLHPANVMMAGESLQVIDFDDAGFGFHAYELAVALFDVPEAHYPYLRDALVRGYRRHRPLDDPVLSLVPTFDLIRRLALLGWLHARPDQSRDYLRELLDRACAQAAEF